MTSPPTPGGEECPYCGGQGWFAETRQVCCRRPNFDGSCCGYGVPEQVQVQCECSGMDDGEDTNVEDSYAR